MFRKIKPEEWQDNPISLIGQDWALLTAVKPDGTSNPMTVSWGGVGVLWHKPVCTVYIRPQRYTHEFSEVGNRISLCFFPSEKKEVLNYCGRVSGREADKVKECGLTPVSEKGHVYYEEARVVLLCRKIYVDGIKPEGFLEAEPRDHYYPAKDYHTVYVCEIEEVLTKDKK
ncbi:MAG: flavin reductase [Clostridia bacterium]|nr:flavin reductase [Clostridia bacterium]